MLHKKTVKASNYNLMPLLHIYIGTKQLRVEHDTTIQKGKKGTDGAFGQTEGFFRGPGDTLKFNKLN